MYLHELLHAFGVQHADSDYAMMNYGVKPWANRADADMMRPLPDDLKALRELYPGTSTRNEVAIFNTWYDTALPPTNGAAIAAQLCKPSLGKAYNTDKFASYCGTGGPNSGSTTICEGDELRLRYTIANYSTAKVEVVAHVFFSVDKTLSDTDPVADSLAVFTINAGDSKTITASPTVPDLTALSGLRREAADWVLPVLVDRAAQPVTHQAAPTEVQWLHSRGRSSAGIAARSRKRR